MDLYITLTVASSPPSSMAHLAPRVADDMAHLHHLLGDAVSDELGISISYLVEQFALLAALPFTGGKGETSMIEFNDSFSQAAVAEAMCAHSGLAKLISQQLMLPGFAYAHDVEGRRIGGPLVAPNPVLHKTSLFVSPRDMREHLPREINFARFRCACNAAGQPVGEWQRVIVGAYVNHGSNDKPDWSSHT